MLYACFLSFFHFFFHLVYVSALAGDLNHAASSLTVQCSCTHVPTKTTVHVSLTVFPSCIIWFVICSSFGVLKTCFTLLAWMNILSCLLFFFSFFRVVCVFALASALNHAASTSLTFQCSCTHWHVVWSTTHEMLITRTARCTKSVQCC